jgi:hypothetical protein
LFEGISADIQHGSSQEEVDEHGKTEKAVGR